MKGSLPFCVNMCQGFGLAKRSDTLPWDSPSTDSPNSLWLMEYCDSMSFTCNRMKWMYLIELARTNGNATEAYPSYDFVGVKVRESVKLLLSYGRQVGTTGPRLHHGLARQRRLGYD